MSRPADNPNELADRRVLVTGAGGFIGHALCEALVAGCAHVTTVLYGASDVATDGAQAVRADLADSGAVERLLRDAQPEMVFHLAGLVDSRREPEMVRNTFEANAVATVNLLTELAILRCARSIVVAGSMDEGAATGDIGTSPYAASKTVSSAYARFFRAHYDLPVRIARMTVGYGPGQARRRLVPDTIDALQAGIPVSIREPQRLCDFVYVEDMVTGLLGTASANADTENADTEIGTGVATPVATAVRLIAEALGKEPPVFAETPEPASAADGRTARRELWPEGWEPKRSLAEGIERTVAWYVAQSERERESQ